MTRRRRTAPKRELNSILDIRVPPRNVPVAANDNGPTPERLRHANDNFVMADGTIRIQDAPIDRLHRQGKLSADNSMNDVLHRAAQMYGEDYYRAGLSPLGAVDYERPVVDGVSPKKVVDSRAIAGIRWNEATKAMGPAFAKVVDMIVIQQRPVVEAGRAVGAWDNDAQARAAAMSRLVPGLEVLATYYGLMARQNERA